MDFWRWAFSDILSNTTRGIFAEYLVATALGIASTPRITWEPYDLTFNGVTIEVKSSAYIQSWKQKKPSAITFGIAETQIYDYDQCKYVGEKKRQADSYIFCVLHHTDRATIDPLNASQWDFYVLPSCVLNEKLGRQKSVSLKALVGLGARRRTLNELPAIVGGCQA